MSQPSAARQRTAPVPGGSSHGSAEHGSEARRPEEGRAGASSPAAAGPYVPLLAGAIAFGVAFPPFPPLIGALLALAGFALALERLTAGGGRLRHAVGLGALFGALGYAPNMLWVATGIGSGGVRSLLAFSGALLVPTIAVAIAAAAFHLARRGSSLPAAVLLPLGWVAGEVLLANMGDVAFPWLPLGLSVAHLPLLLQAADLSGVHGVSAWIAALAGALVDGWRLRRRPVRARRVLLGAAALLVGVVGYGAWRLQGVVLRPVLRVAVVQPDIRPSEKHDPALVDANVGRVVALTRQAAPLRPQLVLWPETALAGMIEDHPDWRDSLQAAARAGGAPVLTGVVQRLPPGTDGRITLYNAATLTDSAGQLGSHTDYRKRALVPITERIPFIDPAWFSDAYPPPLRGFSPGGEVEPFAVGAERVGALICFESTFAGLTRAYRAAGATLVVNLTNDAVLGGGRGPDQHLAHLPVRAVESRVAVVQAANSGVSAYADPRGVLHDPTARDSALVRGYEVASTAGTPLYVLAGDWLGVASLLAAGALAVAGLRARRG